MIVHDLDHRFRCVWVRAEEEVSGAEYVAWRQRLLRCDPTLREYDFIYDLRRLLRGPGVDDLPLLEHNFPVPADAAPGQPRTILVTADRGYEFWVRLLNHRFPQRQFFWTTTLELAERMLSPAAPEHSC